MLLSAFQILNLFVLCDDDKGPLRHLSHSVGRVFRFSLCLSFTVIMNDKPYLLTSTDQSLIFHVKF